MNQEQFFEKSKLSTLFFRAAIPGSIGMFASVIYQFVEAIFISRSLGSSSFAAMNLAFPIVIAGFAISDMLAVGSSVLVSIAHGKKQQAEANRIFTNTVLMVLIVETILGIILGASAKWFLSLIGAEGETLNIASNYLRVYAAFMPQSAFFFVFDNFLRICGKTKTSMTINVISSFAVIGFDALFLFVLKMPLYGAALGSSIAFTLGTLASAMPFILKKLELRFTKPDFSWDETWDIMRNGFPVFLSNIAGRITAFAFNSLLLGMGGEPAVNAYGVLMYIDGFALSILYGMCDSIQPAIGYNYGAGKMDRVKNLGKISFAASGIVCLIIFVLCVSIPGPISSVFLETFSPEEIALSTTAVMIFSFTFLTRWFTYTGSTYVTALKRPGVSLVISLAYNLVFPLILIGCLYNLNLDGLWLNGPLTSLLTSLVTAGLLLYLIKKKGLYEVQLPSVENSTNDQNPPQNPSEISEIAK